MNVTLSETFVNADNRDVTISITKTMDSLGIIINTQGKDSVSFVFSHQEADLLRSMLRHCASIDTQTDFNFLKD